MELQRFTTETVSRAEAFAYWADAVCQSYVPLGCETDDPKAFSGGITLQRMTNMACSQVWGSNQRVTRRKQDIARAGEPSFIVSLQVEKSCRIDQMGRSCVIEPGDFGLYSSTDPYALALPDGFQQHVVQMPREALLRRLPQADDLVGRAVSAASTEGSAVSAAIRRMLPLLDSSNPTLTACLQESVIDLVATGFASLVESRPALTVSTQKIVLRARSFIARNLSQGTLDRESVAQAAGVSVRRLNEILAAEGSSITKEIRDARLKRASAELRDGRYAHLSVGEVAYRAGFENLPHFSRLFKAQFGQAPSDYRRTKGLN